MKSGETLSSDVKRLIPLTPSVFYVLLALSEGRKHGYSIMQETTALSESAFRMGPATLYTTIQRLVALDLVNELQVEGEDSRRRYYELTGTGRELLAVEVKRMNSAVRLANKRLVLKGSGDA
jgi:DNA-binding PadR family transcriptional regulator